MLYRRLLMISIAVLGWVCVSIALFPPSSIAAQDPTGTAPALKLTSDELTLRQENVKSVTDLDEALKSSILQLYERARQQLELAKQSEIDLKKYLELTNQAKSLLDTTKNELEKSPETPAIQLPKELTDAQLQEMLRQKNVELEQAREKAKEAANEMSRRQTRLVELPGLVPKTEKRLEEVKAQLNAEPPAGENVLMTQARMTQLTAEKQNMETQLAAYNAEKSAYAVTADLPPQMDLLAQGNVKRLEAEVKKIKDRIARLRENEMEKRIRQAKEDLENAPVLLKPLAAVNVAIAEKLQRTSARIAEVTRVEQQVEAARLEMSKRYETTKIRVEAIGLSDTLGIMLRQNKAEIAKLQFRYRINPSLRDEVSQNRAESFKSEDEANDLDVPTAAFDSVARRLEIPADSVEALREPGVALLEEQKKAWLRLAELQNDDALFGLLTEQRRFAMLSSEYSSYIDEHVLWMRSAKVLGASERQRIIQTINKTPGTDVVGGEIVVVKSDFTSMAEAVRGILQAENWQSVRRAITEGAKNRLSLLIIVASGMCLLFLFHSRLKKNLRVSSKIAIRRSCREFTPTATTLLETILLSFLWPGVAMTLGWIMRSDIVSEPFPNALGFGLSAVGLVAAPLEFLRHVCRVDGLAQAHFDWPEPARLSVRSNVRWLILAGAPLLLISVMLHHYGNDDWNNSLGRVCTIALLMMALVFVYRVMRPGSPVFRSTEDRDSRFYRLRYFRFGLLVVVFAGTILFAVAGYYYTTYQLGINFLQTMAFAIGILTLYCMALRFLLVRRRRLRYDQLMKQREASQKQRLAAEAAQSSDGNVPPKIPDSIEVDLQNELGTDINSVSRQAKELTGVIFVAGTLVALWQIWQDVLPATRLLDTFTLWDVVVGDKGEKELVTLRDLLISVGLFLVTFFSVRNIPGMLELLLLKQLPLDAGSRYAITTIFRYFIVVVGVILALNFLKIPWSKYSWLVAAISVGLGFGLQEIVANFVSGLIILLERPVRVGDVVTIDGTTGVVSRIQMRATTVTNWDNQELVVPNKDLVTGKLMNWTLSSVVNRVSVAVGVAYGTDVDKVQRLILKIADQNPDVLSDPAPSVSFEEFGDSALNFKLRCCITSIDRRIHIVHALNSAINKVFIREGIVVPFPQRDVHMIRQPEA